MTCQVQHSQPTTPLPIISLASLLQLTHSVPAAWPICRPPSGPHMLYVRAFACAVFLFFFFAWNVFLPNIYRVHFLEILTQNKETNQTKDPQILPFPLVCFVVLAFISI